MKYPQWTLGVALVAMVLAIGAYFVDPKLPQQAAELPQQVADLSLPQQVAGLAEQLAQLSQKVAEQASQAGQKLGAVLDVLPYDFFIASNNGGYWNGVPIGRNATSTNGILEKASVGTCNPTATSTIISVQNPFSTASSSIPGGPATSTIIYFSISGTNGATSSDILVGTSTTPNPAGVMNVATSSLNSSLIGISNLGANVQFFSVAGLYQGVGPEGYTPPSAITGPYATTSPRIVVGPYEWIVGFSTTTAIQTAGPGATTTPASCTYKIIWRS